MPLPATITAHVDPAAVTKVTRLFNNTIDDVLAELIQNARRAGATGVDLVVREGPDGHRLTISDDGQGIADPSVILALGRSGWDQEIARREDPAGMGVFSLAGRAVEISSRRAGEARGWQLRIAAEQWESGSPIPITSCDRPVGTSFTFALDDRWATAFDGAAHATARYCPIPVRLHGAALAREDWLADAVAVVERDGIRLGVFEGRYTSNVHKTINFHGVTVACPLASVSARDNMVWGVRADIVDAPALQLVLPARKEVVDNAALSALREAALRAIYETIASRGRHRLPYANWAEARMLGIDLPEAEPILRAWTPATNDPHTGEAPPKLGAPEAFILMGGFEPAIEQCAAIALKRDGTFEGRLVEPDPVMIGYGWYDALPRIADLAFEIVRDTDVVRYGTGGDLPKIESGVVAGIQLVLTMEGAGPKEQRFDAPVAILYDDSVHWALDEAVILLASPEAASVDQLVDLLVGICFCSSDDRDADSWDTQHDYFLRMAREQVIALLQGDDEALLDRFRTILLDRISWYVPDGQQLQAVVARGNVELAFVPAPASGDPSATMEA